MRVLVVAGTLSPSQLALWSAVHDLGVDVHLMGTLDRPAAGGLVPVAPSTILDTAGLPAGFSVPTTVVHPTSLLSARGSLWWRYPDLNRVRDSVQPTLVHVLSEIWGRLTGQALGIGLPVVAHGCENLFDHGRRAEALVRLAVMRRRIPRLAGYASWNTGGLDRMRQLGLPAPRHAAVVPAVLPDPSLFSHVPPPSRQGASTIAFLGRLNDSKGVDTLLRAVARISLPTRVLVVGSGALEPALRNLASTLEVDAEFRGPVDPTEVPAVLAEVDVVAVPSRPTTETVEQFGRIAVESLWAGRPVVATRCGALPEVLGEAALFSEVDDVAGLAANLTRVLTDFEQTEELVRRGRKRAEEHYRPEAAAGALLELWAKAADG